MSSCPDGIVDDNHHQSQNTTLVDVKVQGQVIEWVFESQVGYAPADDLTHLADEMSKVPDQIESILSLPLPYDMFWQIPDHGFVVGAEVGEYLGVDDRLNHHQHNKRANHHAKIPSGLLRFHFHSVKAVSPSDFVPLEFLGPAVAYANNIGQ